MAALSAATVTESVGDSTVVLRRLGVDSGKGGFFVQAPSPDGRFLVGVDRRRWVLAVKDVQTGNIRPIPTKSGFPTEWVEESLFSPDGRTIAFTWGETRQRYLLSSIGVDGRGERTLFTPNEVLEYVTPVDWTPDAGELLAYVYARDKTTQVAFVSATNGAMRVLKSLEWRLSRGLRLSPDGRAIAYDLQLERDAGARDLFVLEADGSRETRITTDREPKTLLGWAQDGRALFYLTEAGAGRAIWRVPINDRREPGKPEIVRGDLFGMSPVRLQGGTLYYFVSSTRPAILAGQFDFETGREVAALSPVAQGDVANYSPVLWSSDGRQLAFTRPTPSPGLSQVSLALRHTASGEERRVALELERARLERWGPDDRTLEVRGWQRGQEAMYTLDLTSGRLTRTGDVPQNPPRFSSPDGQFEYYISRAVEPGVAAVMERNLTTNAERELHRAPRVSVPALSPDGRTFAFRSADSTGTQLLILLSTRDGRPPLTVRGLPRNFRNEYWTWTPDGRYAVRAFSTDEEEHELWSVSTATGEARRLVRSDAGLRHPHVGPDGRVALASAVGGESLELWAMENLRSSSTPNR
jgi:Tol biopolymer transport system component